nr:MAG TPA: hypothetical protein [Caudoviricetes sp.]
MTENNVVYSSITIGICWFISLAACIYICLHCCLSFAEIDCDMIFILIITDKVNNNNLFILFRF